MANENMIKFLRGNVANLPQTATEGALYFTKDEGIYLGMADGSYHRYGDFITVANVEALPATGAHATCMYYCTAENILARYDSEKGWIQINKQPTAEEMKTLLGLGSAAYTDATDYDAAGAADAVRTYVGDIPTDENGDPIATSVVAYINKKTDGIATSGNLEALGARVTTAEGEIDALQEASAKHVEKEDGKSLIADTEITRLAGMSDGANKVEASENGKIKIDGVDPVVYTHPDKHAISEVDGLQDAIDDAKKAGTDAAGALDAYKGEMVTALAAKQDVIPENTYDAYGSADQALTDAKAYVDEEDIFETDMNTINALGGIGANVNLNGLTTHEVLKKLLYPYVAPSIGGATASPNGGTYEKGVTKTITQVSISITKKSEPITSVALYNGSTLIEEKTGDAVKNGGTITFTGLSVVVPTDGNQLTVKVTYPDANGASKTESKSTTAMTFVYPYYIGTCAAGTAIDETLVLSLTKKIESKGNKSNSFTVSDGHMVIAYPKAHGVLKSILDPNNFETIGNYTQYTVSVTGLDGTAQDYYVYVSGATTVSGFTVNFKY